jgi:flavorubredoxin
MVRRNCTAAHGRRGRRPSGHRDAWFRESVNLYPVRAEQPLLVDSGLPTSRRISWKPSSRIEPADVRWINLMHPDRDHTKSQIQILGAAPNAHLITTFLGQGMIKVLLQWRKHDDIDDWWH